MILYDAHLTKFILAAVGREARVEGGLPFGWSCPLKDDFLGNGGFHGDEEK